ncbi:hypothetical protein FHS27_001043 [Rhodopirellula rubra]|uniref:Uncharacterized protein n=1 Tax=Aporhodopirellula rubra TaxID=980271 RepID=A0A7W5DW94_9BACT|nr:hypothetical protein [Aporhodopirellula rubra]
MESEALAGSETVDRSPARHGSQGLGTGEPFALRDIESEDYLSSFDSSLSGASLEDISLS